MEEKYVPIWNTLTVSADALENVIAHLETGFDLDWQVVKDVRDQLDWLLLINNEHDCLYLAPASNPNAWDEER